MPITITQSESVAPLAKCHCAKCHCRPSHFRHFGCCHQAITAAVAASWRTRSSRRRRAPASWSPGHWGLGISRPDDLSSQRRVGDRLGPDLRRLKLHSLRAVTDDGVEAMGAELSADPEAVAREAQRPRDLEQAVRGGAKLEASRAEAVGDERVGEEEAASS